MCRTVKMQTVCPTCEACISQSTSELMCNEARRRGRGFGRCTMGKRQNEQEFRGEECKRCEQVSELQTSELDMRDFAVRGLGWISKKPKGGDRTTVYEDDSDEGTLYTW